LGLLKTNFMPDLNTSFFAKKSPPPSSLGQSRAQDLSTTKLQQHKDRENAKVSVEQSFNSRQGAVTSINRVGQGDKSAVTSVNRIGQETVSDNNRYDEAADDRRWNYIRRLTKARQAKAQAEAEAKQKEEPSVYDIGTKTGGAFRKVGRTSARRRWAKMRRQAPATYKNLSDKDIKYYESVVAPHAKAVKSGTGFNRLTRKKMKLQIERDRRKGTISYADSKDMKQMVNNLPH